MSETHSIEGIKKLPVFFIIGRERSGTTLLRTLFDAHHHVNIQIEFHFILILFYKYHKVTDWPAARLNGFYNDVVRLPRFQLLTIDKEKLKENILACEGDCSFGELCKVVLMNYVSFFEKGEIVLLGDKCPYYSLYCEMLLKVFPEAKFIHLVRDHRDNVMSMMKVNFESKFFSSLAYRWKYYNKKIEKSKKKYPDSFYTMKYEDMVSEPERYLKEMCAFLNVDYDEGMPEFYKKKDEFMKTYPAGVFTKIHRNLFQKITNEHIYSWKKKMQEKQVKKADFIAGTMAEKYGYERKFKNKNLLLLLTTLPGCIYGRLYFYYNSMVNILPFGLKLRYIYFTARIFRRGWLKFEKMKMGK
jgi:hypothetical protein